MFEKFKIKWLKIAAPLVIILGILIVVIYADYVIKKKDSHELEQKLFQIGKAYEYELKKELEQYQSIVELLSITFSKDIEKEGFIQKATTLIKTVMVKNERISSAGLILKNEIDKKTNGLLDLSDELDIRKINFIKSKKGIIHEDIENEFQDLFIKAEIEKVVVKEQTKILSPLIKRIESKDVPLIPIVSSIYKGKRFLGYLILYTNIGWVDKTEQSVLQHDAFVSASNGKLIAVKDNEIYLSENIEKVCSTCKPLLKSTRNTYDISTENNYTTLCFNADIQNSLNEWSICLRCDKNSISGTISKRIIIWIIGGLVILIGVLLLFYLNRKSDKPWNYIKKVVSDLIEGEFRKEEYEKINNIELESIKNDLDKINNSLNKLSSHNKSAISGNFDKKVDITDFKHSIVQSSKSLYAHLESISKKLAEEEQEVKHIRKNTENLDKIASVLKSHHKDMQALSEEVIKTLVDLMSIAMGAVFLSEQENDETWLKQTVSYAYHENKYQKTQFKLGDSLVGACAAEKRTVHINKIPENYLKIISGLGETSPKSLLIVPLIFEDEVLGVLELGSLKEEFDKDSIRFAESSALSIASTISLAQNNIRNTNLLEQTRKQTKELEEQERKMKEALSELKDLQGKTARSEAEVRAKLEAMNNTLLVVEYTTEGILLDANYKFLNTMNYSLEEIVGNNVIELLKDEDRDELLKVINMVKSGNYYESIMRRHTKQGQEKWFMASYTPVFNDEGEVQNILFFGIDITRIRMNEEKLKIQLQEMTSEIERLKKN